MKTTFSHISHALHFSPLCVALALIFTVSASLVVSSQPTHAATDSNCSFSADGKTYSGTKVTTQGVTFCSPTTSTLNSITSAAIDGVKSAADSVASGSTSCKRTASTGTDLNSYIDNCGGAQQIRVVKTGVKQDKGAKPPAIIFVHGGGWFSDDGNFSPTFQNRAAKWGFTTFRIKYRLMPGGIDEQLQDVMRAVSHVRSNADKYGIDKNRIAIWGDSAGGSLAVRAAATGKTGVKTAIGWSAPTNGFRDMFNSYDGWVAGAYHSRCFGSEIPAAANELLQTYLSGDVQSITTKVASGKVLSPEESSKLLNLGLKMANLTLEELPVIQGKLQKASNAIGYATTTPVSSTQTNTSSTTNQVGTPALSVTQIKTELQKLTPTELAAMGVALYQFTRSAQGITTDDPNVTEALSLMTTGINQLTEIQKQVNQEKATSGSTTATGTANNTTSNSANISVLATIFSTSNIADATSLINASSTIGASQAIINLGNTAANALGINPQQIPAKKIAECMTDFAEMSPALFASPRSPRMFLLSGAQERWVNPLDAYQMRDKLRSMGISSQALVLPQTTKPISRSNADGHMGYDQRAEVPSFQYLHDLLKSKTAS